MNLINHLKSAALILTPDIRKQSQTSITLTDHFEGQQWMITSGSYVGLHKPTCSHYSSSGNMFSEHVFFVQ